MTRKKISAGTLVPAHFLTYATIFLQVFPHRSPPTKREWVLHIIMAGVGAGYVETGAEADIAQMAEYLFCTQSVAGSRPAIGSKRLYHAVQYAHGRGTVVCPS